MVCLQSFLVATIAAIQHSGKDSRIAMLVREGKAYKAIKTDMLLVAHQDQPARSISDLCIKIDACVAFVACVLDQD